MRWPVLFLVVMSFLSVCIGDSSFVGSIWFIAFLSTCGVSFSHLDVGQKATSVFDSA